MLSIGKPSVKILAQERPTLQGSFEVFTRFWFSDKRGFTHQQNRFYLLLPCILFANSKDLICFDRWFYSKIGFQWKNLRLYPEFYLLPLRILSSKTAFGFEISQQAKCQKFLDREEIWNWFPSIRRVFYIYRYFLENHMFMKRRLLFSSQYQSSYLDLAIGIPSKSRSSWSLNSNFWVLPPNFGLRMRNPLFRDSSADVLPIMFNPCLNLRYAYIYKHHIFLANMQCP